MITGNMNIWDILAVYDRNERRIGLFASEKMARLARSLRKGMAKDASKCYDLTTSDKTEFKVAVKAWRNGEGIYVVFAYCKETNAYYRCETDVERRAQCLHRAYTTHYLHRYAQRILGDETLSINATLTRMLDIETDLLLVYQDGEDGVFATRVGMVFVNDDRKREVVLFRTVVSVEMLKTSQASVYRAFGGMIKDMLNDSRLRSAMELGGTEAVIKELARRGFAYDDLYREYRSYFDRKRRKPAHGGRTLGWNDALRLAGKSKK